MKLIGELKNQVEKAETREAARETIAQAGMLLNDDELDQVSGGDGAEESMYCACEKPMLQANTTPPRCVCCGKTVNAAYNGGGAKFF